MAFRYTPDAKESAMRQTICFGLAALLPVAAFAHAHLEGSTPANDSTVQESPANVTLTFSETVGLDSLTLRKAGEKSVKKLGPLPQKGAEELKVPLPKLSQGDYVLSYRAVATDMHETKGAIRFKVLTGAPSATAPR